jgi:hypothetical protein
VLSSEVALPSAAAVASSTPAATASSPPAASASNGGRIVGIVVGALALLALVAAAVFVRQLLRANPRTSSPAASEEHVPAGVRVFDLSDPDELVELDPATERAARPVRAGGGRMDEAEDAEAEDAEADEVGAGEADEADDHEAGDEAGGEAGDDEAGGEAEDRDVHHRSA